MEPDDAAPRGVRVRVEEAVTGTEGATSTFPATTPHAVQPWRIVGGDVWYDNIAPVLGDQELVRLSRASRVLKSLVENHVQRRRAQSFQSAYERWGRPNMDEYDASLPNDHWKNLHVTIREQHTDMFALGHALLSNPGWSQLQTLTVMSYTPDSATTRSILTSGLRALTSLQKLELVDCNSNGIMQVVSAIATLTSLQCLRMIRCRLGEDSSVKFSTAITQLRQLSCLRLDDCGIAQRLTADLCVGLGNLDNMAILSLSYNDLDAIPSIGFAPRQLDMTQGGLHLASCLQRMPHMAHLELRYTNLMSTSTSAIFEAVAGRKALQTLVLTSHTPLSGQHIESLCRVIRETPRLRSISFTVSPSQAVASALRQAFDDRHINWPFETIAFNYDQFSAVDQARMFEAMLPPGHNVNIYTEM